MDTSPYYYTSALMVAFFIILLNSYVISLFKRKRNLRSHSNLFLLSLTFSDMVTGVFVIPYTVTVGILNDLPFAQYPALFIFSDIFIVFSAAITMLNLSAIIFDRYLSLCHPLSYTSANKKGKVLKLVGLMWLTAVAVSIIRLLWLAPVLKHGYSSEAIMENATRSDKIYSIVGAACFGILCLGIFFAFCRMFWSIRKFRTHQMKFLMNPKEGNLMTSEWKAVIIFGAMFGIFLACWSPLVLIRFLDDIGVITEAPPRILLQVLVFIRFLSSLCDPILYTFYKFDFQSAVKEDKRNLSSLVSGSKETRKKQKPCDFFTDEKNGGNSSYMHTPLKVINGNAMASIPQNATHAKPVPEAESSYIYASTQDDRERGQFISDVSADDASDSRLPMIMPQNDQHQRKNDRAAMTTVRRDCETIMELPANNRNFEVEACVEIPENKLVISNGVESAGGITISYEGVGLTKMEGNLGNCRPSSKYDNIHTIP